LRGILPQRPIANCRRVTTQTNTENVSQVLAHELDLTGKEIAFDVNGKKRPLAFAISSAFVSWTKFAIQSESSPVESGQVISTTAERSVFKLLLTGQDDSAVVTVLDRKSFKTSTVAKQEVLDDLLNGINKRASVRLPRRGGLADQSKNLEASWERAQRDRPRSAIDQGKLTKKRELARLIFDRNNGALRFRLTSVASSNLATS